MNHRFALGTSVEHVFAEIAGAVELGLYVYQVDDRTDPGSLRLVYANPASVAATGVAFAEIVGQPIREAFPGLMTTPLPSTYLEIALGGSARSLGEVRYGDHRISEQVFSVEAFPLPDETVGVSFKNLTGQRLAEQQAVQTLESMSDAFMTLDASWKVTYLNPQNEKILGQPREALVGRNIWEVFPEARGSRGFEDLHRALREQTEVSFEEPYPNLGRTLSIRAYPITGGLAVYYTDVTRQRELETQVGQAQRLEAVGRVTASVAHDFNNLLTVIRGCAALGEVDAGSHEDVASYFGEIDSAAQKATELTRQLLSFSRRQELKPTSIDLNEVISGFTSLLRHLMTPDIELELCLAAAPVPVYVDRAQIEQVILNLVVNSRDATTDGTIKVCTSTEPPEGLVHEVVGESGWLQVSDTGSGIPPDVIGRVFEPFFSTKPPETGTGLGLATIYGIATQSGGNVFVASTVGEGTTFTIVLPAHAPSSPVLLDAVELPR